MTMRGHDCTEVKDGTPLPISSSINALLGTKGHGALTCAHLHGEAKIWLYMLYTMFLVLVLFFLPDTFPRCGAAQALRPGGKRAAEERQRVQRELRRGGGTRVTKRNMPGRVVSE